MSHNTIVLLSCKDEKSLMRFPSNSQSLYGLELLESKPSVEKVREFISGFLKLSSDEGIVIHARWEEGLGGKELLLVSAPESFIAPKEWMSLPDILRSMGKGKPRLIYMKAMQVFAGGLEQEVDALEVDEEVRERLRELSKTEE